MSYQCDICSSEMASKSSGTLYSNKDVNICPAYWERIANQQKKMMALLGSDEMAEKAYGIFVQQRLHDSSGFTVCPQCSDLVAARDQQLKSLGLAAMKSAGIGDQDQVLIVAGVAWQQLTGKWPSCLDGSVIRLRDRVVLAGKAPASPNTTGKKSWRQLGLGCFLGMHKWEGCKCVKCNRIRDTHFYIGSQCILCGEISTKLENEIICQSGESYSLPDVNVFATRLDQNQYRRLKIFVRRMENVENAHIVRCLASTAEIAEWDRKFGFHSDATRLEVIAKAYTHIAGELGLPEPTFTNGG